MTRHYMIDEIIVTDVEIREMAKNEEDISLLDLRPVKQDNDGDWNSA